MDLGRDSTFNDVLRFLLLVDIPVTMLRAGLQFPVGSLFSGISMASLLVLRQEGVTWDVAGVFVDSSRAG